MTPEEELRESVGEILDGGIDFTNIDEEKEWLQKWWAIRVRALLNENALLKKWIDNHECVAAYSSLTECIQDQRWDAKNDGWDDGYRTGIHEGREESQQAKG